MHTEDKKKEDVENENAGWKIKRCLFLFIFWICSELLFPFAEELIKKGRRREPADLTVDVKGGSKNKAKMPQSRGMLTSLKLL